MPQLKRGFLDPKPDLQPPAVRCVLVVLMCYVYAMKLLHVPTWLMPERRGRLIVKHWTLEMIGTFIRSFGKTVYIDQQCDLKLPESFEPRVAVSPEYRLSSAEIERFYREGYLGPFPCFSLDEVQDFRRQVLELRQTPSALFGFQTDRDRHFEMPLFIEMMKHPAMTERLAQLLGPDLVCWRTQIFNKTPGTKRIQWHQASSYMVEDFLEPALQPLDRGPIFQLTIWVALDKVTDENGPLEIVRGSHERVRTINLGGRDGFYEAQYELNMEIDPAHVDRLLMEPGEFVIFSERAVHGSGPNDSDTTRLAFNYRVIPPDVPVYPGKTQHAALHMGQLYDLTDWGVVTVRGRNEPAVNREFKGSQRLRAPHTDAKPTTLTPVRSVPPPVAETGRSS